MTVPLHAELSGRGLPVVLLHAFPLSSVMWREQRSRLADACWVITPDQRGFGGSPLGADGPSLDHCADDLAALLDRCRVGRAVVGGLSMGGYVVMAFLRRHPDRVRGVVLADTRAGADTEQARRNRERIASTILDEANPRVLHDDVLPGLLGETTALTRPGVIDHVRGIIEDTSPPAVAWAQRAMAQRPGSFPTLRTADVPALVIVGEEDALSPPDDARAMAEALPRGTLVAIPGAGHLSALETPLEFSDVLRRFVASLR
ncbi:MAG: alpha/beta fold hydrolase [Carbonactinosporaceae bacterium]